MEWIAPPLALAPRRAVLEGEARMESANQGELADIGVLGLGTMGSSLALNIAERGFKVAVINREQDWTDRFMANSGDSGQVVSVCG